MGVQIYDLSGSLCLESGAGSQLSDQIILELSNISILNSNIIIIYGEITTYNSSSDTMLKRRWGGHNSFGVVLTRELEFLAMYNISGM